MKKCKKVSMKKINYWLYEDENYEILKNSNNQCFVHHKSLNKYFFKNKADIENGTQLSRKPIDYVFPLLLILGLVLYIYCVKSYWSADFQASNVNKVLLSLLVLVINVVLHEMGHVLCMRLYGRKIGKVKFSMNFIFPTISVDTSESYMLPLFRRFYVYSSGLLVNIIFMSLVSFFFRSYIYINSGLIIAVFLSMLPIGVIKTDGYHIFYNIILKKNDIKNKKSLFFWIMQILFVIICCIMSAGTIFKLYLK